MLKLPRSKCPISLSLELFGDRWSLLILRDLVFGGTKRYQDFLNSPEKIATNVLADRLKRLEAAGLIAKERDPEDGKRYLYSCTPKGLDTLPVLIELIGWGLKHEPNSALPGKFMEEYQRDPQGFKSAIRAARGVAD